MASGMLFVMKVTVTISVCSLDPLDIYNIEKCLDIYNIEKSIDICDKLMYNRKTTERTG